MTSVLDIGWHHPIDESDQWDGFNESGIYNFAGNPIIHLAREVHQNALDACCDENLPVKVVIKERKVETKTIPNLKELIENFKLCAKSAENESDKEKFFFKEALELLNSKTISVLEISDFNTTGMVGPSHNGTPFYAFMKAKGQSKKVNSNATGSFGIGKSAPYVVSKLRTVFVSTVYEDPKIKNKFSQLTQGKSILMSHDEGDERRRGDGFWGIKTKCQPVDGISECIPDWIQRARAIEDFPNLKGSKLTILGFKGDKNWEDYLALSVAANFFAAIVDDKLNVMIGDNYIINKTTIIDFFESEKISNLIAKEKDERELFGNSKHYLSAYIDHESLVVLESERRDLGLCQLRIFIDNDLPKKVSFLRNGMFITDALNGLKVFSDFKNFVAVVQCLNDKGNQLLRSMEPPKHDSFEPSLLLAKDQRLGKRALKDLAEWVRSMLQEHQTS